MKENFMKENFNETDEGIATVSLNVSELNFRDPNISLCDPIWVATTIV